MGGEDDLEDTLRESVKKPAKASNDSGSVEQHPLRDQIELDRYLSSGGWRGKAGAYNLAELEGHWPIRVDGDPTTVVGLPMATFAERLRT